MEPDTDRIAALVKQDLYEQFGSRYKFEPVVAEKRIFYGYDETEEYYGVWVGYSGCSKPPDSDITIGISTRISGELLKMGLTHVSTDIIPADEFEKTREMANFGA